MRVVQKCKSYANNTFIKIPNLARNITLHVVRMTNEHKVNIIGICTLYNMELVSNCSVPLRIVLVDL